jgi:hypothetical protein
MTELAGWENFFVIVGSSAGALIGLHFVVLTLIAPMPALRAKTRAPLTLRPRSFISEPCCCYRRPSVFPGTGFTELHLLWGLLGICGLGYAFIVTRRLRTQTAYKPVLEDWLFHSLLSIAAYATLAASALAAHTHVHDRCLESPQQRSHFSSPESQRLGRCDLPRLRQKAGAGRGGTSFAE